MGALRTRMIEEMRLRNFLPAPAVLSGGRDRTGQALSTLAGPTHTRGDSRLSFGSGKRRFVAQFAQRGDLGDEVLLPPDVELERQAVVYSAEKAQLATARSVRPEEVERLLLAAAKQRDRCLLMTAYATGLRVSELVRLKVSAIDSERMMVRVEQGKGRKDRYTILSQRLLTELRSYWKEHRSPIYLFPNRKGGPISIDYAQRIYNLAKLKAGIQKGHGIHTLRHCFATHLLEAGVDLRTIQTLLGHNSMASTERYLQIRQHKITTTANPLDLLKLPS